MRLLLKARVTSLGVYRAACLSGNTKQLRHSWGTLARRWDLGTRQTHGLGAGQASNHCVRDGEALPACAAKDHREVMHACVLGGEGVVLRQSGSVVAARELDRAQVAHG